MIRTYTVVLIDDEPMALTDLELTMDELEVFEVYGKFTGITDAMAFLEKTLNVLDFIFCDIEMPGKTGLELLDTLHRYARYVVLCTAHPQYALEGWQRQADQYLLKPVASFDLMQLAERFDTHFPDAIFASTTDQIVVLAPPDPDKKRSHRPWIPVNLADIAFFKKVKESNYVAVMGGNRATKSEVILGELNDDINSLYEKYRRRMGLLYISSSVLIHVPYISHVTPDLVIVLKSEFWPTGKGKPHLKRYLKQLNPGYRGKEV